MSRAQAYKTRFVDIRINPPKDEPRPEERVCDWAECAEKGECRAPMGPEKLNEYYWFCRTHAAEYNRNWNFFADKSDDEVQAYQESASYGHRPTWSAGLHIRAREAAAKAKRGFEHAFNDPFGLFGSPERAGAGEEAPRRRRLGRLEERALQTLGLKADATGEDVRKAYAELVKRFHPDVNKGDRTSEERLAQVIRAYKTLQKAGYR